MNHKIISFLLIIMTLAVSTTPTALAAHKLFYPEADDEPVIKSVEGNGDLILIIGEGFGDNPQITLTPLGREWEDVLLILPLKSASDTEIEALLPEFLPHGRYMVMVKNMESSLVGSRDIFLGRTISFLRPTSAGASILAIFYHFQPTISKSELWIFSLDQEGISAPS